MDINISLNQGKQFKKLQREISKKTHTNKLDLKEGFVSQSQSQIQSQDQSQSQEIQTLQKQFDSLMTQYSTLQSAVINDNKSLINRTNKATNKFLNKNIQTTDGSKAYVTGLGEVKWYGTEDVYNSTAGKNGCPSSKDNVQINFAQTSEYQNPGATIPVDPSLKVGTYMLSGQSCGNEGQNVYVNKMIGSKDSSKIGCYNNSNGDALTKTNLTNSTFEKCKQYAIDNAFKLFGLGEYNSNSGYATCYVGNDKDKAIQYGNANMVATSVAIWSSNTAGKGITLMTLSNNGSIQLTAQNGTVVYETTKDSSNNNDNNGNNSNNNKYKYKQQNYFLTLQADGNLCVYKGISPQTYKGGGAIWCSMTNGKQKDANTNWVANIGKYGKSYLTNSQTLSLGEWIGSDDGKLQLTLQQDGNLVLYTSTSAPGCSTNAVDKYDYGNQGVLSLYELSNVGIKGNLGKFGYVNGNSDLREYPSSMIGKGDTYNTYVGTNLTGVTPIVTTTVSGNESECQKQCTSNDNCVAYTYELGSNVCYQYDNIPKDSVRVPTDGTTFGIRKPKLLNDQSCGLDYTEIDTNLWNSYNKGEPMNTTTKCGAAIISEDSNTKLDDIKNQLLDVSTKLLDKINNFASSNKELNQQMLVDKERITKNLAAYQDIKDKLTNKESFLNMDAMLEDSKINVLSYNYNYVMWTIFAIGVGLITIKHLNKRTV